MTQLLSQFEAETPKFIQFSQLTERSQSQLQGRRFFAAYVNTEFNQYGGVHRQTLLVAETEMHARKYEREFPMYQLVVGIPSQINPAVQPQALKAEKIGPAFNSTPSIQKPAHKEPIVNNSDGSITLNPKFRVGETVLVVAGVSWAKIEGYMIYKGEILYLTNRGELTASEALAETELDYCPQCAGQTLYANHCHDCGWDVEDGSPCQHPTLTAAERNGHLSPVWK